MGIAFQARALGAPIQVRRPFCRHDLAKNPVSVGTTPGTMANPLAILDLEEGAVGPAWRSKSDRELAALAPFGVAPFDAPQGQHSEGFRREPETGDIV